MLTDLQRKQIAKLSVAKLLEYIDNGTATYPDDFVCVDDAKMDAIRQALIDKPNPAEVAEWQDITDNYGAIMNAIDTTSETALRELRERLRRYIGNWETANPKDNHVAVAKGNFDAIEFRLKRIQEKIEQDDWGKVDPLDAESMYSFLAKYPESVHRDEIDDAAWNLVSMDVKPLKAIDRYLDVFPRGRHSAEAVKAQKEYENWEELKNCGDLLMVFEYAKTVSDNAPFASDVKRVLRQLKEAEIARMKSECEKYPVDTLLKYITDGVFSEDELIRDGAATKDSLNILHHLDATKDGLPDIMVEAEKCIKECANGRTDIFFFGIPSTGKSCILMGLIGSPEIHTSYVRAGGPYAAALQQYLDAGFTIGQTPANFVATIEAKIPAKDTEYKLNLVEMAGEDFAFKLAQNPEGEVSFDDMGEGAPALLSNDNRKAFFLIVDPTARVVSFKRVCTSIDGNGNEQKTIDRANINQRITLKRMVDLFEIDENADIMRKVDAIHIIVTKSDTLGGDVERDEKALSLFMSQYHNVLQSLVEICNKYGINVATGGSPKLYTFSLGKFYVGGIYQYDETDAAKLINAIRFNVCGEKKPTFIDKCRGWLNNPII